MCVHCTVVEPQIIKQKKLNYNYLLSTLISAINQSVFDICKTLHDPIGNYQPYECIARRCQCLYVLGKYQPWRVHQSASRPMSYRAIRTAGYADYCVQTFMMFWLIIKTFNNNGTNKSVKVLWFSLPDTPSQHTLMSWIPQFIYSI